MAGLITVRLSRNDSQPWGFRLQGGKDFGAPLLIQKVNGGSLAERAGLQVADAVIKVNGQDVYNLRHKEAQDVIVRAGNSYEIVVSRSPGGTWRPAVTPVGNMPSPSPVGGAPAPVTQTSLAYKGTTSPLIGSGHNMSARPFSATPQMNGMGDGNVKSITCKQYNSPANIYSDQNIAETLSAQAEVLAGGVLGVNFKKNEKTYNSNNSEVLKAVQEIDNEPRSPEPVEPQPPSGGVVVPPPVSGLRHVAPPTPVAPSPQSPALQPGQNICADCERLIVGVFVRIKDKNLHVECFKCATCGTSLKNVGYYNINNKLYCDIHAKLVARSNPPAPNLEPITIPPGGRIPASAMSAPMPSMGGHSPQPSTMAPLPFHAPRMKPSHVSAPRTFKPQGSNVSGPKPFGAPGSAPSPFSAPLAPSSFSAPPAPAPYSTPPAPAPYSSAPAPPPFSAPSSQPSFPKSLPGEHVKEIEDLACCADKSKRMSVCSSEVCELSEKKSALKLMGPLMEDANRASPIPFRKGDVVSESFRSATDETHRKSENVQSSADGNVHITRKTKVEESFEHSQKMYTAEVSMSSHSTMQARAASPEMEQIMAKRRVHQAYSPIESPTPVSGHHKLQSERCLTPEIENLMNKPHGSWSPMPAACFVRPISPNQTISFPPDSPYVPASTPQARTATPEQFQEARETVERFVGHSKHVQGHTSSTGRNMHVSYNQAPAQPQPQQQQYTPRFDTSQGFSPYVSRGNAENVKHVGNGENFADHEKRNLGDQNNGHPRNTTDEKPSDNIRQNVQFSKNENSKNMPDNEYSKNDNGKGNHHGNGNDGNHNNGNKEKEPTVTEPDESEEQEKTDQEEKSSKKNDYSEEESSRKVFSDFGGPQVSSSVDIESTTEGDFQKTSVKKSEQMQYATCEFESTRTSSIKPRDGSTLPSSDNSDRKSNFASDQSNKSYPEKDAQTEAGEEEKITKSQVEEIIKQELNKVFQMAQTMEKTNFGQMYEQKPQHTTFEDSSKSSKEYRSVQSVNQRSISNKVSSTCDVTTKTGKLTSGLTIAPARSFTPQALESRYPLPYQNLPTDFPPPRSNPEPPCEKSEKPAYIPLTGIDRNSPMLQALTIAPDRPYSPLIGATIAEPPSLVSKPIQRSSMLDALTTAPSTPFQIHEVFAEELSGHSSTNQSVTKSSYDSVQKYSPKPSQGNFKPIPDRSSMPTKPFTPVANELKSAFKSTSKTISFAETEDQKKESLKQTLQSTQQRSASASRVERPITPSGLHAPNYLPSYQQNIGEIPLAHRGNSPVPHQIKAPSITPPRAQSVPRQVEKVGTVKAMSEAYNMQLMDQNQQQVTNNTSSVSYISAGAKNSVTKTYSYEQDHKSIDVTNYHPSPLAGKLPVAGELTLPKCSSPVMGKLDHTKQMFKPAIPSQQPTSVYRSPVAEQANLRQAPPYFVQEKEKPPVPWSVIKDKDNKELANKMPTKLPQQNPLPMSIPQPSTKSTLPPLPSVNKPLPGLPDPSKPFSLPGFNKLPSAIPDAGPGGASKSATTAGTSAPRRGRGVLNAAVGAGGRVPLCGSCNSQIRGPFITALGKIWCPEHFVCVNAQCRRPLQDIGFVEEGQGLYCEFCFEQYLAPTCSKCNAKVKGDCLNAIGKHFHPECFVCAYCGKLFGNNPFFLEDALPYCEADWNELFTTKCFSCGFPIEAGDRWVEALNNNYHSLCFNCTMCKKNLEGQSFFAKGGRPFCKNHAR